MENILSDYAGFDNIDSTVTSGIGWHKVGYNSKSYCPESKMYYSHYRYVWQ